MTQWTGYAKRANAGMGEARRREAPAPQALLLMPYWACSEEKSVIDCSGGKKAQDARGERRRQCWRP